MNTSSAASIDDALWTATAQEPAIRAEPLTEEILTDVAIIGGGITGCAAALALAETGASVHLVEAKHIGWGASGRNGGQVIPGLKYDPPALREKFGERVGQALVEQAGGAADFVFSLIEKHQIRCSPQRKGWIQAAHSVKALETVLSRARSWQAEGAPIELLEAPVLAARTGAVGYHGGWRDARAGTIQPLAFVRGLARAAQALGAVIHTATPVLSLSREGDRWKIQTPSGVLWASSVIIATDAYSDRLIKGLEQTIIKVQSIQIATEPLSEDRALPGGECMSETRRLAFYFRRSPDGRIMFGGRGAVGDRQSPAMFTSLIGAMSRILPGTKGARIDYRWSGQVGLTLDGLPKVHEPLPGVFIGLGYNGRGVAMATRMGHWLAARIHADIETPLPRTSIEPHVWHRLRRPVIAAGVALAWTQDRLGLGA
ncbi:FAD-binding oxidoreductase [Acidisoma cellulosilytica]|uniref:FAD-binding oxidoreductase n=1 Tax=Acidisoma cellulosilyticum TaxID=2802395 RepID=A0A964E6G6_9PROT|nr:FAD-binding oxidoreductase [Acidisoma cellulosilyticum]MCB8883710.1 FAD-binding oxidoreductase [Acidisoma cellulosilyticum]